MALYGYIRALQGDSILTSWRSWLLHTSPAILTTLLAMEYWLMPASERIDLMLGRAQLPHSASVATTRTSLSSPSDRPMPMELSAPSDKTAIEYTEHHAFFQELTRCMEQGAYRDSQLSLQSLAQQAGLTTHQASAAINQCAGHHFYDWLNHYRIQAAQTQLRNTELAITQICYDVGYNSKSTFNVAFRKWVGCTPSQYRRDAQAAL